MVLAVCNVKFPDCVALFNSQFISSIILLQDPEAR